jgi:hypothetical protein
MIKHNYQLIQLLIIMNGDVIKKINYLLPITYYLLPITNFLIMTPSHSMAPVP